MKEKFKGLRWVPLEPEFIDYPNAQFLMIGEAQGSLGKAATAEGGKQAHEEEPGQELEKLEAENEHRVQALEGKILHHLMIAAFAHAFHRRSDHFRGSWLPCEEVSGSSDYMEYLIEATRLQRCQRNSRSLKICRQ